MYVRIYIYVYICIHEICKRIFEYKSVEIVLTTVIEFQQDI
jgi:hypothetical protein